MIRDSKAALRKFLEGWRGKPYADNEDIDLSKLLGQPCLLKVKHRTSGDRVFHEVESASLPVLGGQKVNVDRPTRQPVLWSIENGKPSQIPEWLPWLYGKSIPERVAEARDHESNGEAEEFDPDEPEAAPAGQPQTETIPF